MKTRTALRIDHYIGTVLCWAMSLVVRAVGIMLRRDHRPPYTPKRILFIKLMGAGSVVQALPAMVGVRNHFPNAAVRMMCFPETVDLAKRLAFVEKTYTVNNTSVLTLASSCVKVLLALLRWRPDLAIDLEYHSKFSSLLSALTLAQNRGGLFDVSTRFRDYLYTHLVYANPRQHIADLYMQVARIFGVTFFPSLEESMRQLRISTEEEANLEVLLRSHDINPDVPLLVINPNAGDLCLERRWPIARFGEVASALVSSGKVILVGSPKERAYVESVLEAVPQPARSHVINTAGALSFGAWLALLRKASLVITNDSGPMHLAAAFGAPTVSLWGPGAPQHYEPRTSRHVAVWARLFCSPCLYVAETPPCRGDNACMEAISVHEVLTAAVTLCPSLATEIPPPSVSATPRDSLLGVLVRDLATSPKTPAPRKDLRSTFFNEHTVLRAALLVAIVFALIKWAGPALHLWPTRATVHYAQATATYDPQIPGQDYSADRLVDNSIADGLPNDAWVLPDGQLGSAQLTWDDPLRVSRIELLNTHAIGRTDQCSVSLDGHSLGVFPVNAYPFWTILDFEAASSPPVTSLKVQIVSTPFAHAGINEIRIWGYPANGHAVMLAKALILAGFLAAIFVFPRAVQAVKWSPKLVGLAVVAHLVIIGYIAARQTNCIKAAADLISPIADGFSESNVIRGAESFADLGFLKYAGLPDACYGNTWKEDGFPAYIAREGQKTDAGYLIPSARFPVSPDHYVYTHYPPGPEWIAGIITTLFGKKHFFLLRAFPVGFGLLAIAIFAVFLWRQVGPPMSVAVMAMLAATPMFTNMMHGLHYQGYAQSLLLVQIAVLGSFFAGAGTHRRRYLILLCLIAFAQGYMSFDYCFLVTFAAIPICCFAAPGPGKNGLARLAWAVAVAGLGFSAAHAVHFAQVAVYYGSFAKALEDFAGAGNLRLQSVPLLALASQYGWQLLYDGRFFYPFAQYVILAAPITFLLQAAARLAGADVPNLHRPRLMWRFCGVLSALLICSGWIAVMRQHASMHTHFLPRHFFLLYLCLVLFIVNGYTAPTARPRDKACEANQT